MTTDTVSKKSFSEEELKKFGEEYESSDPQKVIAWALETFGDDISLACSLGAEDVVLADMVAKTKAGARAFYLDTNLLFKETYAVRDEITAKYDIELTGCQPLLTLEEQSREYGEELWKKDPNLCCKIRKMDPLEKVLGTLSAWITGIRRDQAPARANAKKIEWDARFGLVKINPLADWTSDDVWNYIRENNVPYCALHDQNYPSIGCEPCTKPVAEGEDPRAGRWAGFQKTECGLHGEQ